MARVSIGNQIMSQHHIYRFDDFLVDPDAWKLCENGDEVHLEPIVLKLLIHLISHRDRLVTRQELMDTVWGDTVISESALSKAVARLRKALNDDSAAPRYLETLHSQGYRFVAEVEESDIPGFTLPPRAAASRRYLWAGAAAIVALGVLAGFWVRSPWNIESLAVLPLGNLTGDPEQEYYVDGLQEILITELSQLQGLRVTSRQSTKRYRDSELPVKTIAKELGVDALVEGSLLRTGSEIEVSIQLIHGQSDEHLWADRYVREASQLFDLVSDVAIAIGTEIDSVKAPRGSRVAGHGLIGPVDPRAVEAYALGLMHMDRFTSEGIRFAIEQFQEAVRIEPGFALALGQLGVAHAMNALHGYAPPLESIERARAIALQTIKLDDQFYFGHSILGWARLWTRDFDGACESFEEALRLNPSAPYALHGEADCLMLEGRMEESVSLTRELLSIAPYVAMHNRPLAFHLFIARRYDAAISAALAAQQKAPGFSKHALLARIYWAKGDEDQALEAERQELDYQGDAALLAALEKGLETAGPSGALRAMAEVLVSRSERSYVDPFVIGESFARAGAIDDALLWLDQAVEKGSFETTYIAFRPDFDVLRQNPRYWDLAARVYGQGNPHTAPP
jgi:TolB-like protein/DNA-binding winged helix-turn-helix (wHTH) protein